MSGGSQRTSSGHSGSFGTAASALARRTGRAENLPTFSIEDVAFVSGRSAIDCLYRTTENCGCLIYGAIFVRTTMTLREWFTALLQHASPHDHTIAGLSPGVDYAIRIYAVNGDGIRAWRPSESGYYIVRTAGAGASGLVATIV